MMNRRSSERPVGGAMAGASFVRERLGHGAALGIVALIAACSGPSGASGDDASAGATTKTTSSTATDGASSTSAGATTSGATTSGATTSTSGAESTTAGDTCSFLACVDEGGGVIDPCDAWAQDCPEGEKCAFWADDGGSAWNSTKCVPVAEDPDGVGEPCTVEGNGVSGVDSCAKGAMCWNVDPRTNTGECIALCAGDVYECSNSPNECCPEGTYCAISRLLNLCVDLCHPLTDPCPDGNTCIPNPNGSSFLCVVDASGDLGAAGDPCEFANVCDPGLYCINSDAVPGGCGGATGCCSPWCDLDDPNVVCPVDGEVCTPWFEEGTGPAEYQTLGICALVP